MTAPHPAAVWAAQTPLDPVHVDCITALMLKILDGKCKMSPDEKAVIAVIYDVIKGRPGKLLDPALHPLISAARAEPDDALLMQVYEQRLLAETMISRPVMKGFKAMLRERGVLSARKEEAGEGSEG